MTPIKSFAAKVGDNIPCNCSMSTKWAFDLIKIKHDVTQRKRLHGKVL